MDNKKIKQIDIVCENCEVYTIESKFIERMYIDNLKQSIDLHPNGLLLKEDIGWNEIDTTCDEILLVIKDDGIGVCSSWDIDFQYLDDWNMTPLYKRINQKDITHVDIIFEDGSNCYISVPWDERGGDFYNNFQISSISDDNKILCIKIAKNINEEEFLQDFEVYCDYVGCAINNDKFIYNVPNYVSAALNMVKEELDRVMWNINQEKYENPFSNTGNNFHSNTFDVQAYNWDDENNQQYNFKYKDYEVQWYKYFGRGMCANREISPDECSRMLDDCLKELNELDSFIEDFLE